MASGGFRARLAAPFLLLLAVATAIVAGAVVLTTRARAAAPPSLVLITLDTTRADRIGAYGHRTAHTPTLDGLARRGALFERAYAATPVTLPSHATLLTGIYPPGHGVRDNGIHALAPDASTLAEILREAGYRTAAFVSAAVLARRYGLAQGFEVYDDDLEEGRPKEPRMVAERPADRTVDRALRWLDQVDDGEPMFLWVHLFDPHAPYAPPPRWAERFPEGAYDGEIAFVDAEVGRLLAHPRLDRDARGGHLLVAAIADHGESLGEHDEASHGMLPYDATLRVPWIVAGHGVAAARRIASAVTQADLLPTVLALLGLPTSAPRTLDGENLAPLLRGADSGGDASLEEARLIYAETLVPYYAYGWAPLRAAVAGPWKLIEAPAPELYDVVSDPGERRNLHGTQSARAAALRRRLVERWGEVDAAPREARSAGDAAAEARLRSLGYVGGRGASVPRDRPRPDPKAMMDVHRGVERAEAYLYARQFEDAIRELRGVLDRDSTNLAALEDIALALGELGQLDDAERALERALAIAPASAGLRLTLAQLLGARGRWDEALAGAEAAIALGPADTGALALRAEALDRLGRRSEAAAAIAAALEIAPGDPLLETRFAEVVDVPAGRLAEAEARLVRASTEQPYLASAWRALGRVRAQAGRPVEARSAYTEGLRFQPRDGSLHGALGLLLVESDAGAARRHLEQAVALSPVPSLEVLNALADLLASGGDERRAGSLRERVLALPADAPEDRHQRAIALRSLGRVEEAVALWQAVVAATPDHAPAWQGLAAAALDRRALRDAAAAARRAVELDSELATAWNVLAIATEELEGKEAAVAVYRRAIAADPDYWQASLNLGLLLRDLGRAKEAGAALEAAAALAPRHARTRYELGLLYAGPLADPARARRHLEEALRLEPAHPRAGVARQALDRLPSS